MNALINTLCVLLSGWIALDHFRPLIILWQILSVLVQGLQLDGIWTTHGNSSISSRLLSWGHLCEYRRGCKQREGNIGRIVKEHETCQITPVHGLQCNKNLINSDWHVCKSPIHHLSSFYCIEARARGNLTCFMLLYNATNIAFSLLTTPSVLTQVPPRQESGRYWAISMSSSNAIKLQTLHKNGQNLPQYNKRSEVIQRNSTTQEYTQGIYKCIHGV